MQLAASVADLPMEVRAAFDPLKKRPNPKMRKKLAMLRAPMRRSRSYRPTTNSWLAREVTTSRWSGRPLRRAPTRT